MEDIEVKCLKVSSEQIKNNYTFGKSAMKDLARYIDKTLDILEQLEKENERLENQVEYDKTHIFTPQTIHLNFIPKSVIREKLKELEEYEKLAKEQINNRIVIADSDSLNYGRAEAHSKDIQVLYKLLGGE